MTITTLAQPRFKLQISAYKTLRVITVIFLTKPELQQEF